jgi:hypothetical protein
MKRLSWITVSAICLSTFTCSFTNVLSWQFVFLPLMFISVWPLICALSCKTDVLTPMQSLFGMNIDVLASNPHWWLYIPFAIVTVLLTLVVWLIFKYSNVSLATPFPVCPLLIQFIVSGQYRGYIQPSYDMAETSRS